MSIKVLLVDDDEDVLFLLRSVLDRRGFVVDTVSSAAECLARLAAEPVRIVVTDIQMPDMDGIELAGIVLGRHPGVAVVVLSGVPTTANVDAALETGAFTFLSKPVDATRLEAVLLQAAASA